MRAPDLHRQNHFENRTNNMQCRQALKFPKSTQNVDPAHTRRRRRRRCAVQEFCKISQGICNFAMSRVTNLKKKEEEGGEEVLRGWGWKAECCTKTTQRTKNYWRKYQRLGWRSGLKSKRLTKALRCTIHITKIWFKPSVQSGEGKTCSILSSIGLLNGSFQPQPT